MTIGANVPVEQQEDPKDFNAFPEYIEAEPEPLEEEVPEDENEYKLVLDPSKWTYQDYAEFLKAMLRGDWEKSFPLIMKICIGWTYPVEFSPEAYRKLSFADLPKIAASVDNTTKTFVDGFDTDRVKLNMRAWDMDDYFNYRQAAMKGDVAALEVLFHKVAKLPGLVKGAPMSFEQGAIIASALGVKVSEMFSKGK